MIKQIAGIPKVRVNLAYRKLQSSIIPIEKVSSDIEPRIAQMIEAKLAALKNSDLAIFGVYERKLKNGDVVVLENLADYPAEMEPVFRNVVTLFKKDGSIKSKTTLLASTQYNRFYTRFIEKIENGITTFKERFYKQLETDGFEIPFYEIIKEREKATPQQYNYDLWMRNDHTLDFVTLDKYLSGKPIRLKFFNPSPEKEARFREKLKKASPNLSESEIQERMKDAIKEYPFNLMNFKEDPILGHSEVKKGNFLKDVTLPRWIHR